MLEILCEIEAEINIYTYKSYTLSLVRLLTWGAELIQWVFDLSLGLETDLVSLVYNWLQIIES